MFVQDAVICGFSYILRRMYRRIFFSQYETVSSLLPTGDKFKSKLCHAC